MNVSNPYRPNDNREYALHMSGRIRQSTFRLYRGPSQRDASSTTAYMHSPDTFGLRRIHHHIFARDELCSDVGIVGLDDLMVDAALFDGRVRATHVCSWPAWYRVGRGGAATG